MRKNCGIIAGMSSALIKRVIENVSLKAFADGEDDNAGGGDDDITEPNKPSINYEDLIAKARREEKEKQYKTIEKLKGQIETLTKQHNSDLLIVADLDKKLEEANTKLTKAGSGDGEDVKVLKETINTLTKDKEALDKKIKAFEETPPVNREEVVAEVRSELEAEYEVKTYKANKMAELKDDILVPELIMGTTKEEIDLSIETALERSTAIKKSLGLTDSNSTKKKVEKRTPRTVSPSVSGAQDGEISLEYLATLDVRSKEYAEVRKQLGLK